MRKNFGTKSWFYPLPVLIIATFNEDGTADAMNAAWGGLYDADKVVLCLSAGHKTTENIQKRRAFTVSFADAAYVIPADYVGMVSAHNEADKMEKAGFHVTKSEYVDAPLIDELPVALECHRSNDRDDDRGDDLHQQSCYRQHQLSPSLYSDVTPLLPVVIST